jgi:hypothetical protein
MAISPLAEYPGNVAPGSSEYPFGRARNVTVPGDGTGTPWEEAFINDLFGFFQAFLDTEGTTPTGTADTATASQYQDALAYLSRGFVDVDVAGAAEVTLDTKQGRVFGLRLTGTLTANINLIVPAAARLYAIVDDTSGAFDVTVKTAAGSGVTLSGSTGGVVLLRSNGANVVPITGEGPNEIPTNGDLAGASITGTATFTNSTNNIALTGIFAGLAGIEVGDVIQVSGSVSNNKEFTVEVITDSNNIIVNQAHAGGGTTKSLVNETSTAGVTVAILAKWYNAASGMGQGWITSSKTAGTVYTNVTNREIKVFYSTRQTSGSGVQYSQVTIGGSLILRGSSNTNSGTFSYASVIAPIPRGVTYEVNTFTNGTVADLLFAEYR